MKKTATYYLLITLVLFLVFTIGIFFLFSNNSNQNIDPNDDSSQIKNSQFSPQPLPLIAETDNYESVERIQEEKPWIKNVPIVQDNFITRFDYETNSIQIIIYTQEGKIKYSEDDLKKIRALVEQTLSSRGIDLNSVKITARVE